MQIRDMASLVGLLIFLACKADCEADQETKVCGEFRILSCRALWKMTIGNASCTELKACASGATEVVVAAICTHGGNAGVQKDGCAALAILAVTANFSVLKTDGAISAVVASMRAHAGGAGVQRRGCAGLSRSMIINAGRAVKAESAGAIQAVQLQCAHTCRNEAVLHSWD